MQVKLAMVLPLNFQFIYFQTRIGAIGFLDIKFILSKKTPNTLKNENLSLGKCEKMNKIDWSSTSAHLFIYAMSSSITTIDKKNKNVIHAVVSIPLVNFNQKFEFIDINIKEEEIDIIQNLSKLSRKPINHVHNVVDWTNWRFSVPQNWIDT